MDGRTEALFLANSADRAAQAQISWDDYPMKADLLPGDVYES
jgi:hypothetical protein